MTKLSDHTVAVIEPRSSDPTSRGGIVLSLEAVVGALDFTRQLATTKIGAHGPRASRQPLFGVPPVRLRGCMTLST